METIVNIQLQIQDLIKLANVVNIKLVDIETTLLQSGETYKEQVRGDIYSILGELRSIYMGIGNGKHIIYKFF